jgi:hypothetical protein
VIARLLASGAMVATMPRPRHKHRHEGLIGLAVVLAIAAAGWGVMVWLTLR